MKHSEKPSFIIPFVRRYQLSEILDPNDYKNKQYAYIVAEIDSFRSIIELCGDDNRDAIVTELYRRLNSCKFESFNAYQISENKFVCIVEIEDDSYSHIIESILACFEYPVILENLPEVWLKVAGGISLYPHDGNNANRIMVAGDHALSIAKTKGGSYVQRFNFRQRENAIRNQVVHQRLCYAINHNAFDIHFQPIYDTVKNTITACEVLARWNDEQLGYVNPTEFISIAEKTGLIKSVSK